MTVAGALTTLTEMAGLKWIDVRSGVYVTTAANAEKLKKSMKRPDDQPAPGPFGAADAAMLGGVQNAGGFGGGLNPAGHGFGVLPFVSPQALPLIDGGSRISFPRRGS